MRHIVRAAGPWEYYVRKVCIGLPHECWEWQGSCGGPGYGNWGYKTLGGAHRETYKLFFGDPKDLQVNHRCGNRRCCNPDHLYAGTQKQNHVDMQRHGTYSPPPLVRGAATVNQHGRSPLTEDLVRVIRQRHSQGERGAHLARELNLNACLVYAICNRKNWKWVKD